MREEREPTQEESWSAAIARMKNRTQGQPNEASRREKLRKLREATNLAELRSRHGLRDENL